VCRGVTREYFVNISHGGAVASIIANLLRPNYFRDVTWASCHFRSSQNLLADWAYGERETHAASRRTSGLVIERSKTNRVTDRQRNVEIKQYVESERKGS
jgi:hypothetical protein